MRKLRLEEKFKFKGESSKSDLFVFTLEEYEKANATELYNVPWFIEDDINNLPGKAGKWEGYVYAIEYGDTIKIGCTSNLKMRIKQIESNGRNYADIEIGRIIYSVTHTNYAYNEKILHKYLDDFRKGDSERFNLNLNEFLNKMPILDFRDESKYLEEKSQKGFEALKSMCTEMLFKPR